MLTFHHQVLTCTHIHDPRPTTISQTLQKRACGTVLNQICSLRQISAKLITQANLVFTSGLIYMFLLQKLSSVSNLLWFCSFQRSPGLVFVRLQLCDAIYLLCRLGVCPSLHRFFCDGFRADHLQAVLALNAMTHKLQSLFAV